MAQEKQYPYPSLYGSHISMVIGEGENDTVTCKDEYGDYWTYKDRLDNKLADPCRYSASHRLVTTRDELFQITQIFGPGATISPSARNLQGPIPDTSVKDTGG